MNNETFAMWLPTDLSNAVAVWLDARDVHHLNTRVSRSFRVCSWDWWVQVFRKHHCHPRGDAYGCGIHRYPRGRYDQCVFLLYLSHQLRHVALHDELVAECARSCLPYRSLLDEAKVKIYEPHVVRWVQSSAPGWEESWLGTAARLGLQEVVKSMKGSVTNDDLVRVITWALQRGDVSMSNVMWSMITPSQSTSWYYTYTYVMESLRKNVPKLRASLKWLVEHRVEARARGADKLMHELSVIAGSHLKRCPECREVQVLFDPSVCHVCRAVVEVYRN